MATRASKRLRGVHGTVYATTDAALADALAGFVAVGGAAALKEPALQSMVRVGFFFVPKAAANASTARAVGGAAAAVLLVGAKRLARVAVAPPVGVGETQLQLHGHVELLALETLPAYRRRGCARALAIALQATMRVGTQAYTQRAGCMVGDALALWKSAGFALRGAAPNQPLPPPGAAGAAMPARAVTTVLAWTCPPAAPWACHGNSHAAPAPNAPAAFYCATCGRRRDDMPRVF